MTRGRNAEGYPDPTASIAIERVAKEERAADPVERPAKNGASFNYERELGWKNESETN